MDIYSPIIIFFDQISQNIPILKELLAVIIILGILAGAWLGIVLFFTFATIFFAILWLPQVFKSVYNLGVYHPLVEKPAKFPCFGEYDTEKFWKVLKANLVVGTSLLFVLLYIFNTIPTSFFDTGSYAENTTINQSSTIVEKDQFNLKILNGAFALALMFVPSFLLSLRLFANPTQDWINSIIQTENRSTEEIKKKIRYFKDQVISYYYSFIVSTIILLYFSMLLVMYVNGGTVNSSLLSPFMPRMDTISIIFFIVIEFVAVIFITLIGEWYLKISPPIDQD
jgi:hypothetical protein